MKSDAAFLLRYMQNAFGQTEVLKRESPLDEIDLIRILRREAEACLDLDALTKEDVRRVLGIAGTLFLDPTRSSRDLAENFALSRDELIRLYRIIRSMPGIQDLWTFESPLRRRVSFLRRELLPENAPTLLSMFTGETCLPNHVEFHPALMCNLRCRACPNTLSDSNGDWHFLGYPELGEPLNAERMRLIQKMFLEMGVASFSFGGGGEPSLSELTLQGIAHLRGQSERAEISLYTNGIFPESWGAEAFATLVTCLNKIRFSIDAADAQGWSQYKGRPPEFFEVLWKNIEDVVRAGRQRGGTARIGASCLVSDVSYRNVEAFLTRARDAGLDFCDIKEVETCFGEKSEFNAKGPEFRDFFDDLMARVRNGYFAPMDVVVDDRLLAQENAGGESHPATRCWVSIRGRMLTVGPYGEMYPCSDAANPGSQERRALKHAIGQLTAFDSLETLSPQFTALWSESLAWRTSLSRSDCAYCVPSHTNYNLACEKLFEDWKFGIMPEDQPFAGVPDHYLASRGARR